MPCDGDGPIAEFRRRCAEFYADWYHKPAQDGYDGIKEVGRPLALAKRRRRLTSAQMDTGTDTQAPATPDEIRSRIRSEHAQISAMVARVEALSERVGAHDPRSIVALREELQALGDLLMEHLHYEEYQLPTLAAAGNAESVAAAMRQEHEAQRELLDGIIRDLDETAIGTTLVTGVRELARAIRDDMEQEERELLSEE